MTEQHQQRPSMQFKPLEIIVGAVAAMITAFASSALGVAGTLGGAAVASVVTTVSSSVLRHSAERTNQSLRRTNRRLRQTLAYRTGWPAEESAASAGRDLVDRDTGRGTAQATDVDDRPAAPHRTEGTGWPDQAQPADGRPAEGQSTEGQSTGSQSGSPGSPRPTDRSTRRLPRWSVLAGAAAVVFVLAMGGITGLESILGRPLSALFGHGQDTGSSVGQIFDRNARPTPAQPTPTTGPATTGPANSTTSEAPASTPAPTTAPSTSAAPPPAAPTTQAPAPGQNASPSP
jgi:hypothetical protein